MNNPIHTEKQYRTLEKHFKLKRPFKEPVLIDEINIAQIISDTLNAHGNVMLFGAKGNGATTLFRKIEALPNNEGSMKYYSAVDIYGNRNCIRKDSASSILLDDAANRWATLKPFDFHGRSIAAYFSFYNLEKSLTVWNEVIPLEMPNQYIEIKDRGVFYEH